MCNGGKQKASQMLKGRFYLWMRGESEASEDLRMKLVGNDRFFWQPGGTENII